ncbi:hypothetical protein Ddc_16247 [Ditylenchus destructor]|nr:hypothetical protein Ddc_16247 [Ditylenchus destructor]
MSNSKPLPPFTFEVLCCLNRDQLERLSIVCRPLKNFIERYFHSKPYRIFGRLEICGGSYALFHYAIPHHYAPQWHPNRDDYSVQQFFDGQICSIHLRENGKAWDLAKRVYYSFTEMRPYLGPTVRTKKTRITIDKDFTYNSEHIAEMESIAYFWSDGKIEFDNHDGPTVAEDILPILNSPIILQCRVLDMYNTHFSFKDCKILFTVKIIETCYYSEFEIDLIFWFEFLEQPGVKPVVILNQIHRSSIDSLLERLYKVFSSAVSPNAFKIVFKSIDPDEPLTKFQETNKTSGEILQLKEGLSTDFPNEWFDDDFFHSGLLYTLERTII